MIQSSLSLQQKSIPTNVKFILISFVSGLGHDYIFSLAIKDFTLICTYTYFIPFALALKLIFMNTKYFTQFLLLLVTSAYMLNLFYKRIKFLSCY